MTIKMIGLKCRSEYIAFPRHYRYKAGLMDGEVQQLIM